MKVPEVKLVMEESATYDARSPGNRPDVVARFLARELKLHLSAQERMVALFLDTRMRIIGWQLLGLGTLNRISVEPRQALQGGLLMNANCLILAHNHPSGDPEPSAEDLAFTRRMAEAGQLIGIQLMDHLILTSEEKWVSLRRLGGW